MPSDIEPNASQETVPETSVDSDRQHTTKRGVKFWMCILSIMITSYLIALDLTGTSTALPVIVNDLQGSQFEWVGSAYSLSATAFMPLVGGLAQVWGRRVVTLGLIFLLALGSALSGAAPSLNFLIAGRTVQGLGAGGINTMVQIILSDLVPLKERGSFQGFNAFAYGAGAGTAPVIAGALANRGQWRWFFYLNIPLCAVSALVVLFCLDLNVPHRSLKEKLASQDITGNILVIASTTAVVIALTWAGTTFSWSSPHILAPLILGNVGLVLFMLYEFKFAKNPVVPFHIVSSPTAISGYLQNFLTSFYMLGVIYYVPVYFQACKDASPVASGVDIFGIPYTIAPMAIIAGITVTRTGHYRPQLWFSWTLLLVAAGLLSTVHADTSRGAVIGYQVIAGFGTGFLMVVVFYPVLAPIPLSDAASALSLYQFVRFLSQVWGITVGGTVLQNQLKKRLPTEFVSQFPGGSAIAYAIIPNIPSLDEPLKSKVQAAFADGLIVFWQVLIGAAGLGLVSSFFMKALPLHSAVSKEHGLKDGSDHASTDSEKGSIPPNVPIEL